MTSVDNVTDGLADAKVSYKSLGEVGTFIRGNGLQKSDLTREGVPAIHYGQLHTFYGTWTDKTKSFTTPALAARLRRAKTGDLIVVTTSEDDASVAKATAWLGDGEVAVSGDAYIYRHALDPRYVAYFFQSKQFQDQKAKYLTGTKVRRISGEALAKIQIPIPSIETQSNIARMLDGFTELLAELDMELETRRSQYRFYREQMLTFSEAVGVNQLSLGQICLRASSGATPLAGHPDFYEGGSIPWLRTQEVVWRDIFDTEVKITERAVKETAVKWIKKDCVIVAISGASAGRAAVNRIPLTTNQHCFNMEIDPASANFRYVYHWVASNYEKLKALGQGARSDLNASIIKSFPIDLPALAEQQRIAEDLDTFDALVNDFSIGLPAELAARRKQFEYYSDTFLAFGGLVS